MDPKKEECIFAAQRLYAQLQKLSPFGEQDADLSYALLVYVRHDWPGDKPWPND